MIVSGEEHDQGIPANEYADFHGRFATLILTDRQLLSEISISDLFGIAYSYFDTQTPGKNSSVHVRTWNVKLRTLLQRRLSSHEFVQLCRLEAWARNKWPALSKPTHKWSFQVCSVRFIFGGLGTPKSCQKCGKLLEWQRWIGTQPSTIALTCSSLRRRSTYPSMARTHRLCQIGTSTSAMVRSVALRAFSDNPPKSTASCPVALHCRRPCLQTAQMHADIKTRQMCAGDNGETLTSATLGGMIISGNILCSHTSDSLVGSCCAGLG